VKGPGRSETVILLVLCVGLARIVSAEEGVGQAGVTAGAITAQPFEYVYGPEGNLTGTVVVTEDRHLRIFDERGRAVQEIRTGVRFPRAVYADATGVIHIHDPAGEHLLVGYHRGALRLTAARRPAGAVPPAIPPGAIAVYPDRSGNIYSISAPGLVTYGSAGGYRLWERPLPSTVRDHVFDGTVLFLGLADGSVFGFFPDGEGEVLARVPDGITTLVVLDGALWAMTEGGRVYRLSASPGGQDRRNSLVVGWSGTVSDAPGFIRFLGSDNVDTVLALKTPEGPATVRLEGPDRIIQTDTGGNDTLVIHTPHVVRDITALPRQNALFVEYTDWRFALIPLKPPDGEGGVTAAAPDRSVLPERFIQRSSSGAGSGALAALAEATLQGGSAAERRALLETLRNRMDRGGMYAAVSTSRSILADLVREPVTAPAGLDAPEVRREAIALLGRLGDGPSRRILSDVVRYDPLVRLSASALVEATAGGLDDSGAIGWGLRRFGNATPGEREILATALLQAVSRVVPDGRGRDGDLHREVLAEVAAADLPREIRRRALSIGRGW
jgi:hypothetical protein